MLKKILFLITLCTTILCTNINVLAKESYFYEAEMIPNIFISKMPGTERHTIYYQQARFFRQSGTNTFAYCIEPEAFFKDTSIYHKVNKPYNLSDEQIKRISAIAYYGYQYPGHEDNKWYAITQFMIWKEADPQGVYYFTNGLNGKTTNYYAAEMKSIEKLINENADYSIQLENIPKIIESHKKIEIKDINNNLNKYKTTLGKIEDNKLILENIPKGEHKIKLSIGNTNQSLEFYESSDSQNLMLGSQLGNDYEFNIKSVETSLKIKKVDSNTKSSQNNGNASIVGTKFKLYDNNKNEIKEIIIDSNGEAIINNLDFGKYILKEQTPGTGYILDDKEYKIEISEDNPTIELTIENDLIKKEITIHKTYGDKKFIGEPNVIFEIYDDTNNLVKTITTDENGYANFYLNYGSYIIRQINTKEGYKKVEPIQLDVFDTNKEIIELQDYKIPVPNTYSSISIIELLLSLILNLYIC